MQTIKCTHCGKTLLEASGEVKKKCPSCKKYTHVVVTSKGIINITDGLQPESDGGFVSF